jgi:hypothetical protein
MTLAKLQYSSTLWINLNPDSDQGKYEETEKENFNSMNVADNQRGF